MSTSSIKGLPPGVSLVGFDTPNGVVPNTNSRTQPNGGVASATYNGYGGEIVPQYRGKPIKQLTQQELDSLIKTMAHREGFYA